MTHCTRMIMMMTEKCWTNMLKNLEDNENLDVFSDGNMVVCRNENDAQLIAHIFSAMTGNNMLIYRHDYECGDDDIRWIVEFEF